MKIVFHGGPLDGRVEEHDTNPGGCFFIRYGETRSTTSEMIGMDQYGPVFRTRGLEQYMYVLRAEAQDRLDVFYWGTTIT